MKMVTRCAAGVATALGLLLSGGTQQANAAACPTSAVSVSSMIGVACDQQNKTWTLTSTNLPTGATVDWTLVTIGAIDQHTMTVNSNSTFAQGATYTLDYTISIAPLPPSVFTGVTGGILLGAPGGVATLDKTFVSNGGAISPLHSTTANPFVSTNVPFGVTSIATTDILFVDSAICWASPTLMKRSTLVSRNQQPC